MIDWLATYQPASEAERRENVFCVRCDLAASRVQVDQDARMECRSGAFDLGCPDCPLNSMDQRG
ncbi:hypothetical protein [Methylococcus mesophilus]|uniref:hypothetical protein n=1 Tax=Methylococcus mesophilus TaxID=2993564 RepID=UPI00224B22DF|nr:hypothetical protein [Methylococcus mesophilus]UZR29437.1 hypothetical protein OOT43_02040 [Methylococcus mesophilus]